MSELRDAAQAVVEAAEAVEEAAAVELAEDEADATVALAETQAAVELARIDADIAIAEINAEARIAEAQAEADGWQERCEALSLRIAELEATIQSLISAPLTPPSIVVEETPPEPSLREPGGENPDVALDAPAEAEPAPKRQRSHYLL